MGPLTPGSNRKCHQVSPCSDATSSGLKVLCRQKALSSEAVTRTHAHSVEHGSRRQNERKPVEAGGPVCAYPLLQSGRRLPGGVQPRRQSGPGELAGAAGGAGPALSSVLLKALQVFGLNNF